MLGAIMLGGMDPLYMQRLSICLRQKFNNDIQIGTVADVEEAKAAKWKQNTLWVGNQAFIEGLRLSVNDRQLVLMTEEKESRNGIYMYQSADKIYRKLCMYTGKAGLGGVNSGQSNLTVFTASVDTNSLTVFSLLFTAMLSEERRILYINLSECSGVEQMMPLSGGKDLSDLFLDIKCNEKVAEIDPFVENFDNFDLLRPFKNPMVLHEINEEDLKTFLKLVLNSPGYDLVVFAAANSFGGFSQLLQSAQLTWFLRPKDKGMNGSDEAWEQYLSNQLPGKDLLSDIRIPSLSVRGKGMESLMSLCQGEAGGISRRCIDRWKMYQSQHHGR